MISRATRSAARFVARIGALAFACAVLGAAAEGGSTAGSKSDSTAAARNEPTAQELIAGAIDLTRGRTSYAEFSMVIHRPDWERTSKLVAWTRGREDALIRFTAPPKD